jgi:hypothetical protein
VQGVLQKNQALLAAAGICVPNQEAVKNALTKPINVYPPPAHAGFEPLVRQSGCTGRKTVVISDENLLGFLNDIFSHGEFYPNTAFNLAELKTMLPVAPVKIVIAIRAYDSFFASAYGRWLAPKRMVLSRGALAELVRGLKRGWPEVLADIAAAFPDSPLVISEYSPDPRFGPAHLAALLGPLAEDLVFNPDFRWNRSMSARQTQLFERAVAEGNAGKAKDIRTWKRFKQPPLLEGFWDEATTAALRARYAADKATILKRFPAFVTNDRFEEQDAG